MYVEIATSVQSRKFCQRYWSK